jgi:hypothetical protein
MHTCFLCTGIHGDGLLVADLSALALELGDAFDQIGVFGFNWKQPGTVLISDRQITPKHGGVISEV